VLYLLLSCVDSVRSTHAPRLVYRDPCRLQLLWNLERRITHGDAAASAAIDKSVFNKVLSPGRPLDDGYAEQLVPIHSTAPGDAATAFRPVDAAPSTDGRTSTATATAGGAVQRKKKKATANLIDLSDDEAGQSDEEEDAGIEEKAAGSAAAAGGDAGGDGGGDGKGPVVYEVRFEQREPPHLLLEEFQPGNRLIVKSFPRRTDGSVGAAEQDGRIQPGDFVTAVNGVNLDGETAADLIRTWLVCALRHLVHCSGATDRTCDNGRGHNGSTTQKRHKPRHMLLT
jgi:hypothetical protein